jgi:hypothetical protein
MKILTKADMKAIPPVYSQEKKTGGTAVCVVKFFTPDANWTWFVTEGNPIVKRPGNDEPIELTGGFKDVKPDDVVVDWYFFGLVHGFEKELGYFTLSELQKVRGQLKLPVERDRFFNPKMLKEISPELF